MHARHPARNGANHPARPKAPRKIFIKGLEFQWTHAKHLTPGPVPVESQLIRNLPGFDWREQFDALFLLYLGAPANGFAFDACAPPILIINCPPN
jgi:hypothetical protein